MKRLNLEDFKSKNTISASPEQVDALLGQVLGNCHDQTSEGNDEEDDSSLVGDAFDDTVEFFGGLLRSLF